MSQINSINAATLKTKFVNKHAEGQNPSLTHLTRELLILNILSTTVELCTFVYYINVMVRLYRVYSSNDADSIEKVKKLLSNVAWFFGVTMALSAFAIWISFFVMRNMLVKSVNLKGSRFKDQLQTGFLIIGLIYVIRSVYSIAYVYLDFMFIPKSPNFGEFVF